MEKFRETSEDMNRQNQLLASLSIEGQQTLGVSDFESSETYLRTGFRKGLSEYFPSRIPERCPEKVLQSPRDILVEALDL